MRGYSDIFNRINKKVDPIIISGIGRCGTSLLTKAISESRRLTYVYVRSLAEQELLAGHVYKTHDSPIMDRYDKTPRAIFMFGNIVDVVISTSNKIDHWGKEHFKNFNSNEFQAYSDLFHRDSLHLEKVFDQWYKPQQFPLLTLRYESLFEKETVNVIEEFLGFKVKMPSFQRRKTKRSDCAHLNSIKKVYSRLNDKIETAENYKIW